MIEDDETNDQFKYTGPDNAGVKVLPPFIYLGFIFLSLILNYYIGFNLFAWWSQMVIGILLMGLGSGIAAAAFTQFTQIGTGVKPITPTTQIVSDGIFAYTRNPMYLGLTLVYVGFMVLCDIFWGLVLTIPLVFIIRHYAIAREEEYLSDKFGEEYEEYKSKVRRWL